MADKLDPLPLSQSELTDPRLSISSVDDIDLEEGGEDGGTGDSTDSGDDSGDGVGSGNDDGSDESTDSDDEEALYLDEEDESGDDDSTDSEEEPAGGDSEEDSEESEIVEELATVETKAAKLIKAKAGEADISVPDDALWDVKVNGEVTKVPTKALLESYSSVQANHQRHSQVLAREENLKKSEETFNSVMGKFAEMAQQGKAIEAFSLLCETAGLEPLPVVRSFRNEAVQAALQLSQMSEEEKKLLDTKEEIAYRERRLRKLSLQEEERTKSENLTREVVRVGETYGVPTDREGFSYWRNQAIGYFDGLKKSGQYPVEAEVTPDIIGRFYEGVKQRQMMDEVIESVAPQVKNNPEAMKKIATMIMATKPTREKLEARVRKAYGSKVLVDQSVKNVNGRIKKKAKPSPNQTLKPVGKQKRGAEEDPGLDIDRTPSVMFD